MKLLRYTTVKMICTINFVIALQRNYWFMSKTLQTELHQSADITKVLQKRLPLLKQKVVKVH